MKKNLTQRLMTTSMLAMACSSLLMSPSVNAQELSPTTTTVKSSTYVITSNKEGIEAAKVAGGSGAPTISKDLYSVVCPAKNKCTTAGLYMSPQQALRAKTDLKEKTALIDVRTLEEINYVGNSKAADAYVPYVNLDGFNSVDTKKKALKTVDNAQFLESMKKTLAKQGLSEKDPIILICRSGDRSARAADLMTKAGYLEVYTVTEGFEGDLDASGTRRLNGWKNAGLEWGYNFDESKMVK